MAHKVERVLAIDDDRLDLKLIGRGFGKAGGTVSVETCLGSAEAVATMRAQAPDLVLLDISMPGENGFEVLTRARAELDTMPVVIMLSSSEDPRDIEQAYQSGAAAYVVKPSSMSGYHDLAEAVSAFWGKQVVRPN